MIIRTHIKNPTRVSEKVEKPIDVTPIQDVPQKEKASKKIRKRRDNFIITDPVPPIELPQEVPIDVPVEDNINE